MIKGIMPTEKGMYIIDALEKTVPDMLSVDMTGDMEMELDKIARGKSDGNDFLNNYKKLSVPYRMRRVQRMQITHHREVMRVIKGLPCGRPQ